MKLKILILSLIILIVLTLIGVLIELPSSTPYSIFNTGENGLSIFAKKFSFKPLLNMTSLGSINPSETIIIVPILHHLDNATLWKLKVFIENGGVAVILDEKGYINNFLNLQLDIPVWIVNATIYDEINNYEGNMLVPLINISLKNKNLICYTYKPYLLEVNEKLSETKITVIGVSSSYSYRDNDGNGYFSVGDEFGSYPIIVKVNIGNGTIYIISDLDLFTNRFINIKGNEELALSIVENHSIRYIYMSGINGTIIDYIKAYLYQYSESPDYKARILIEFIILILLATVVYYGEKKRVWK